MAREDVLLNDNYDLAEADNEWLEGESEATDVELLLLCNKGEIREFPYMGYGINRQLNSRTSFERFKRDVSIELENDGFKNTEITGSSAADFKINV